MNDYIKRNLKTLIILAITIVFHVILLIYVNIFVGEKQKRKDNTIFKMVDVKEYKPPEPKPKKEEKKIIKKEEVVQVTKQEDIVEEVIETEKEVEEVEEEYLPPHLITELPVIKTRDILKKLDYPDNANKLGIEGVVFLQLFIDKTGLVRKVEILKDPGYGFGDAAVKAFEGYQATPAMANGIPVAVIMRYPVRFKLKK